MAILIGLVSSIYDSTEDAINKMIAANERTLNLGDDDDGVGLATATRRLRKLQISTLRGAPRDARQLEWIIRRREGEREREKEQTTFGKLKD